MAFSLIAHTGFGGSPAGGTSSAINTTGADLIVLVVPSFITTSPSITDSKGNTWTPRTLYDAGGVGGDQQGRIYYCNNPSVGTLHTFIVSGSGIYAGCYIAAYSGSDLSAPYDVENGQGVASSSSAQSGSITPNQANSLVIAGIASKTTGTLSIDGGFTIQDQAAFVGGVNFGGGLASLIQTSVAAANPSWSWSSGAAISVAVIAAFKPAAGGGGGSTGRLTRGGALINGGILIGGRLAA